MSANPYSSLPETAFWKSAVAQKSPFEIAGLWNPKFNILPQQKVLTAGSCFAQHIGQALAARGYRWLDAEPAPDAFHKDFAAQYGYGVFSFRTGNIYTPEALRQWLSWAAGTPMPEEVWEKNGRYFDPFRPNIEPEGFESLEKLRQARITTLAAMRAAIAEASVLVFTLGLTEAWVNKEAGYTYAMCPGTVAGTFDAAAHQFVNFDYDQTRKSLIEALKILRSMNRRIKVLLTVSPVPLIATASGEHVLPATIYSKSVLRAVAGSLCAINSVDYFPSYEIITGVPFRAMFFEPNMRAVARDGVDFVMNSFFRDLFAKFGEPRRGALRRDEDKQDLICEEELLGAFGG